MAASRLWIAHLWPHHWVELVDLATVPFMTLHLLPLCRENASQLLPALSFAPSYWPDGTYKRRPLPVKELSAQISVVHAKLIWHVRWNRKQDWSRERCRERFDSRFLDNAEGSRCSGICIVILSPSTYHCRVFEDFQLCHDSRAVSTKSNYLTL